jgi:hypothetical protein
MAKLGDGPVGEGSRDESLRPIPEKLVTNSQIATSIVGKPALARMLFLTYSATYSATWKATLSGSTPMIITSGVLFSNVAEAKTHDGGERLPDFFPRRYGVTLGLGPGRPVLYTKGSPQTVP